MNKATDPVTPRTRLQVLDPFIAEIHEALGQRSGETSEEEAICLTICGSKLTVDPWTGERLDPRVPVDQMLAECCRVVTQSVALLAKCSKDLEAVEGESARGDTGLYGARAELMLDAAIGESLVRDVQLCIDDLLKSGRVEEAGHLSKFHHQLRHTVYELRKQVSPEQRPAVETLAEQLSDSSLVEELEEAVAGAVDPEDAAAKPDAAATEAASEIEVAEPPAPETKPAPEKHTPPIRHRPLPGAPDSPEATSCAAAPPATPDELREVQTLIDPNANSGSPSRTAVLAVVLIVAALCLLAVSGSSTEPERRPVATQEAEPTFASVLLLVQDRAPALQLTVDRAGWLQLTEERRLDLMRELTGGSGAARYEEVLVRDAEEELLTVWTVPEEEPPPDPRAKAKGRAAPPAGESPTDPSIPRFERQLAVPGKRGVREESQSD